MNPILPYDSSSTQITGRKLIHKIATILSVLAIAFGVCLVFGATKFFQRSDAQSIDLGKRFFFCGGILILAGIWNTFACMMRYGPKRKK